MATQREIDRHDINSLISRLLKMNNIDTILDYVENESKYVNRGNKAKIESSIWGTYYLDVQALAGLVNSGIEPKKELSIIFMPLMDKLTELGYWNKPK